MRSVVVTGVSSGIGYETTKLILAEGGRVFGSVRRREDADRLAKSLGERFTPLLFDVRNESAVRAEAQKVREALDGRTLSGLVNNVGTALPGPLLHQPIGEIRDQIETNLIGAFIVSQAFIPLLGADRGLEGPPGRIVNMSSIGGFVGQPFAAAYIASKHGLEGFSDTLRRELRLYGIDVIIVAPGVVRTPIWNKVEPQLGRFAATDYGEAYDTALKTMLFAGRRQALPPQVVARTIWRALTAARPRVKYMPSQHPIMEQGLLRIVPRRVLDWAMGRHLGLRPTRRSAGEPAE